MKKRISHGEYLRRQQMVLSMFKSLAKRWESADIEHCIDRNADPAQVRQYIIDKKLNVPVVAPAAKAVVSDKIDYVRGSTIFSAIWEHRGIGLSIAWRRQARALSEAGVNVALVSSAPGTTPSEHARLEVLKLLQPVHKPVVFLGAFPTNSDTVVRNSVEKILQKAQAAGIPENRVALINMIERDRIGPLSVSAINRAAQVWLPNEANIAALARSGVERAKLRKVYVPFFDDNPILKLVGRRREPGRTRFYHVGTLGNRKHQTKMLRAFFRAFRPGEAHITIKTSFVEPGSPNPLRALREALADEHALRQGWSEDSALSDVALIHAVWTEDQVIDLHRRSDVYVSLSHGEGWDMPAYDALLAGNRMVYTASGGPQEFAAEGDLLVDTIATPRCSSEYRWEPDARWIDYDVNTAAEALRTAHENPIEKKHRRSWDAFTAKSVGGLMREYVEEMREPSRHKHARKPRLAIVSLFRDCADTVDAYVRRIETLNWPGPDPYVVCVEGDSADDTGERLDSWAERSPRVKVLHHDLGKRKYGSVINPERLYVLSTVSNVGLDYIAKNLEVDYVLFVTSDLLYEPDLAVRLFSALSTVSTSAGLVSPMLWMRQASGRDVFYDSWAFRESKALCSTYGAAHIGPERSALLAKLGTKPYELMSVGSTLFCRAEAIYQGVRFTTELDVVGFCHQMRANGYTVWADPTTHMRHPSPYDLR